MSYLFEVYGERVVFEIGEIPGTGGNWGILVNNYHWGYILHRQGKWEVVLQKQPVEWFTWADMQELVAEVERNAPA